MTDIKFSSLILPFKKNLAIESDTWVRHLNTLLARGGGEEGVFQQTNLQMWEGDYAELIDRLMK